VNFLFDSRYIAGGRLDAPFYPTKPIPHVRGKLLKIPEGTPGVLRTFTSQINLIKEAEFLVFHLKSRRRFIQDNFDVMVGGVRLFETVYCKNMEEGTSLMVAYLIPANTPIQLIYRTYSGEANDIEWGGRFLMSELNSKVEGSVKIRTCLLYKKGAPVDMGNFTNEWTQWHNNNAGDWQHVYNAGRYEITNLINQSGYSGWYNQAHLNETDYYFEMKYQSRYNDDDMVGAFFRVQPGVSGFYSIEHDGTDSWINGGGFRIMKHQVTGTTTVSSVLAYSQDPWILNAHRAYKIEVIVKGSKITAKLYGESQLSRPAYQPTPNGVSWEAITVIEAEDSTYTRGAWGPLTNSTPQTFYWDLDMYRIAEFCVDTDVEIPTQEKVHKLTVPTYVDTKLSSDSISELVKDGVDSKKAELSVDSSDILETNYRIVGSSLTGIKGQSIPANLLYFKPYTETEQYTEDGGSLLWAKIPVDSLD
jgi:hypothetical protein